MKCGQILFVTALWYSLIGADGLESYFGEAEMWDPLEGALVGDIEDNNGIDMNEVEEDPKEFETKETIKEDLPQLLNVQEAAKKSEAVNIVEKEKPIADNKLSSKKIQDDIHVMASQTNLAIVLSMCGMAAVLVSVICVALWIKFMGKISSPMEKVKHHIKQFVTRPEGEVATGNPNVGAQAYSDNKADELDMERQRAEESDEENEDEADFTVYECQGPALGSDGMEICNPLFHTKMGNEAGSK